MPSAAYFTCTGKTQGLITRGAFTADSVGNIYVEGHEDECMTQSYSHAMEIPTDPQSGQPSGQRQHKPFLIVKDVDKASPLLANALATGEMLTNCTLNLYRTSAEGKQEQHYSIHLTDAIIIKITQGMPNARSGASSGPTETISLSYRKVIWEHKIAGTSGADDWRSPQ